jgi:hypothetical protein
MRFEREPHAAEEGLGLRPEFGDLRLQRPGYVLYKLSRPTVSCEPADHSIYALVDDKTARPLSRAPKLWSRPSFRSAARRLALS